jgi:hypothetical protein
MAIQVSGTTVVDNSRNLTNIAGADIAGTLQVREIIEGATTNTTTSGTYTVDADATAVVYMTSNQTGNRTINFDANTVGSLNGKMANGDSMSFAVLLTNGGTAYYVTTVQIDGSTVTPKWIGGTAPSAGNTNSIDAYTFTIIKTGSGAYTVLAAQSQYA